MIIELSEEECARKPDLREPLGFQNISKLFNG